MLRPQDNAKRERRRLDGLWRFRLDVDGVGRRDGWAERPLEGARQMAVPASYNDILAEPIGRLHVGSAWYETDVWIPAGWAGRRIAVYFESVTHHATVWADGAVVGEHTGGYTPFEIDLTGVAVPGAVVRLTVEVDNTLTFQTIPIGVVVDTAHGKRQRYWHDFFNYSGIHRSVWLAASDPVRLDDVTVVTDLDGTTGIVRYAARVDGDADVRATLRDSAGAVVAEASGAEGVLEVADVHAWAPGDGYLYELALEVGAVDEYRLPVGIRTVRVDGTRFLINGEPFRFRGFAMHEDIAVIGKGHNDAYMLHDFALLEWIGANSIRTSHYPYSEEVLDYADRHGIVVIDETAAVGLNMGIGGGVFGAQGYETYSESTINASTRDVHAQAIRELVARDKNHPSVVLWSIANEPESHTEAAEEYFAPLFDVCRNADPTRPVGFVNVVLAPHGECRLAQYSDVIMINRYYGWYHDPGDLPIAEDQLEAELRGWATEGKPIIMTEYGADTMPGLHSVIPSPWTEEFQTEFLATYHRVFDRIEAIVGEQVWVFADFATTGGTMRVGGNRKGVFTRDRQPKAAAFALRERWRAKMDAEEAAR
ncbi:beta-glucuronidase [Microbacterium aoyamense]|uniref:Beta-glucuronidase n=1 Tax=Microbacterium aoyamense TaxID=344166 RepID=A0ABN2PNB7_9MICO|nr:beta-glucuronidase [Microbacterium aoyamense]